MPHGGGEVEPTGTFRHITYVNINEVERKRKNATYYEVIYITDDVLHIRYRRNRWSQFVGALIAK